MRRLLRWLVPDGALTWRHLVELDLRRPLVTHRQIGDMIEWRMYGQPGTTYWDGE